MQEAIKLGPKPPPEMTAVEFAELCCELARWLTAEALLTWIELWKRSRGLRGRIVRVTISEMRRGKKSKAAAALWLKEIEAAQLITRINVKPGYRGFTEYRIEHAPEVLQAGLGVVRGDPQRPIIDDTPNVQQTASLAVRSYHDHEEINSFQNHDHDHERPVVNVQPIAGPLAAALQKFADPDLAAKRHRGLCERIGAGLADPAAPWQFIDDLAQMIVDGRLPENELRRQLRAIRDRRPNSAGAYLRRSIENFCARHGIVPPWRDK